MQDDEGDALTDTTFQASAPLRLDFAGGWTDVAPFAERERGVVVNAAISLRANAALQAGGDRFVLQSDDLDQRLELEGTEPLASGGGLPLLRAALRRAGVGPCALRTWSEVPAGSGLGSSGALGVALTAALDAFRGRRRGPAETAEEAWLSETVDAAIAGGKQDQYAAAFGGFNRLVFERGTATREAIRISDDVAAALAQRLVVCYTGSSRVSGDTIARVMTRYVRGDRVVVGALQAMAELADAMAEALPAGDMSRIGRLLNENWMLQQLLDPEMCTEPMARLAAAMQMAGGLGGKAAGAGAGGSMFFVTGDRWRAVQAAREAGARILDCAWSPQGVLLERTS